MLLVASVITCDCPIGSTRCEITYNSRQFVKNTLKNIWQLVIKAIIYQALLHIGMRRSSNAPAKETGRILLRYHRLYVLAGFYQQIVRILLLQHRSSFVGLGIARCLLHIWKKKKYLVDFCSFCNIKYKYLLKNILVRSFWII